MSNDVRFFYDFRKALDKKNSSVAVPDSPPSAPNEIVKWTNNLNQTVSKNKLSVTANDKNNNTTDPSKEPNNNQLEHIAKAKGRGVEGRRESDSSRNQLSNQNKKSQSQQVEQDQAEAEADSLNHIKMATEDLLQSGHIVKERWKVVSSLCLDEL